MLYTQPDAAQEDLIARAFNILQVIPREVLDILMIEDNDRSVMPGVFLTADNTKLETLAFIQKRPGDEDSAGLSLIQGGTLQFTATAVADWERQVKDTDNGYTTLQMIERIVPLYNNTDVLLKQMSDFFIEGKVCALVHLLETKPELFQVNGEYVTTGLVRFMKRSKPYLMEFYNHMNYDREQYVIALNNRLVNLT